MTTTTASSTSITVQWIPGFDGGHPQTFTVEYRKDQSDKWVQISISGENRNLSITTQSFTVTGLQPGTLYYVRMFAFNLLNQSEYTAIHTVWTMVAGIILQTTYLGSKSLTESNILKLQFLSTYCPLSVQLFHFGTNKLGLFQVNK